jgi:hypothetical protein
MIAPDIPAFYAEASEEHRLTPEVLADTVHVRVRRRAGTRSSKTAQQRKTHATSHGERV